MLPKPVYEALPMLYGIAGLIGLIVGHNVPSVLATFCGIALVCIALWIVWARYSYRLIKISTITVTGRPKRRCSYR